MMKNRENNGTGEIGLVTPTRKCVTLPSSSIRRGGVVGH